MKDQRLTEETLSTQKVYSGPVFDVYSDSVKLYNGTESRRDYLLHRGAVAIVPLTDDGCVIMERQYRYPHKRVMYEIPAGKLEAFDTDPLEAAKRELLEEQALPPQKYPPWAYTSHPPPYCPKRYMYILPGALPLAKPAPMRTNSWRWSGFHLKRLRI